MKNHTKISDPAHDWKEGGQALNLPLPVTELSIAFSRKAGIAVIYAETE